MTIIEQNNAFGLEMFYWQYIKNILAYTLNFREPNGEFTIYMCLL